MGSDAIETARLAVLRSYGVLDTPEDPAFDDLTELAAQICQTPIALITLIDSQRQWFKSKYGLQLCSAGREDSFCEYAVDDEVLIIEDAREDPRFAANPAVIGDPWIRFYAGAPLRGEGGEMLGTLCVLDRVPRVLSELQLAQLTALSRQVMAQLTLGQKAAALAVEIEARKVTAAALEEQRRGQIESERRWRSLVENAPVGVAVVGADGAFYYANQQAQSLYGGTAPSDLVGRLVTEFVPADEQDDAGDVLGKLFTAGAAVTARRTVRQSDGNVITVELNAALVDYQGRPAIQVQLRDISTVARADAALRESEARWRHLVADSPVGIGMADEQGRFVTANPALCEMLGRPEAEVLGHQVADFAHPEDLGRGAANVALESATDEVVRSEQRYLRPDGQVRWAWSTVTVAPGLSGQRWTIAHLQDVTERKADEQSLRDSEANLSAVSRVVRQIQSGADARESIVQAAVELADATYVTLLEPTQDGNALRTTAASTPGLVGIDVSLETSSTTGVVFRSGQAQFMPRPTPSTSQAYLRLTDAKSAYIVPVRSADVVTAVLAVGWDHPIASLDDRRAQVITLLADQAGVALRQSALLAELESLALTDPLTALPNRRDWNRRIAMLMKITARSRGQLTVAIADLDHFKNFNDSYGHPAGDVLLRDFATAAQTTLRVGDTVARWGGEEFTLALPDCPAEEASTVLDRVRLAVPMGQTCSIGHATWNGVETADELMARADKALYEAKSAGRNQVLLAS